MYFKKEKTLSDVSSLLSRLHRKMSGSFIVQNGHFKYCFFLNFLHRNDKKWIFERLGVDTISWRLVVWNTSLYRQMEYCQNYFCLWVLVKNILRLSERNIITHCDYLCVKVQWVQSCPAVRTFLILTIFKQ